MLNLDADDFTFVQRKPLRGRRGTGVGFIKFGAQISDSDSGKSRLDSEFGIQKCAFLDF